MNVYVAVVLNLAIAQLYSFGCILAVFTTLYYCIIYNEIDILYTIVIYIIYYIVYY